MESIEPKGVAAPQLLADPGLQLYTVRDRMVDGLGPTLEAVAKVGYRHVELAHDLMERDPAELEAALDSAGLRCTGWLLLPDFENPEPQIETVCRLGASALGVALATQLVHRTTDGIVWRDDVSLPETRQICDDLNGLGEACRAADLTLVYHNHWAEFQEVEGRVLYERLLEETEPALVGFELDLCWMVAGGGDPLDYIDRYPGRFTLCHAKDVDADNEPLDLGHGLVDFPAILARSRQAGFRNIYVERDDPQDSIETARVGYEYLTGLARSVG